MSNHSPNRCANVKPFALLHYVEKLLPLIDFCRNTLIFSERATQELCKLKKVRLKGNFYSPEFNRKFLNENAAFSFEKDKNRKGHYHICVNDAPLVQWFRPKAQEWKDSLEITTTKQNRGLKSKMYLNLAPKAKKSVKR